MKSDRRPSLFWPLALVSAGILLLLQNFNLLPPGTLAALVQLWPVFLILLGLDMLIGRRSALGAVLMLVIGLLVIGGALTWAALRATSEPSGSTQALIQTTGDAETATVAIDFKVGELNVSLLQDSIYMMEGEAHNGPGESVRQRFAVAGTTAELSLSQQQSTVLVPFLAGQATRTIWNIRLSPKFPLTLNVDTGVGSATLDLSELRLTQLTLDTGVGQTDVTFPASGAMQANINAGVGEVILTIPEGLATRITVSSGLTSLNIPSRFARSDDVYTTANFSTSGGYLELTLDAGVGSVTVQ